MIFRNYDRPGPGVPKNDDNKPILRRYFEVLSRKYGSLIKLNILHIIFSIPFIIITMFFLGYLSNHITTIFSPILARMYSLEIDSKELVSLTANFDLIIRFILSSIFMYFLEFGPIATGFTFIVHNYTKENHVFVISDILDKIKSNIKQSLVMWIIDIFACFAFYVSISFYSNITYLSFVKYFLFVVVIHYLMMHFYIYPIMTRFDLPLRYILKNAFILTVSSFGKNLLFFAINLIVHILLPFILAFYLPTALGITIYIVLEILILPMLTKFTYMFFTRVTIDNIVTAKD